MKKILVASACALALSTAMASAQSSQGDAGPGTMNNKTINSGERMGTGTGMSSSTTGSSMGTGSNMGGNSNMGTMNNGATNADGIARNPSSQGNVGPGTDNNRPGSMK